MPVTIVTAAGEVVERTARPSFTDRRGAADSLIKLGTGPQLAVDDARARVAATVDMLRAELAPDVFERVARKLAAVWA